MRATRTEGIADVSGNARKSRDVINLEAHLGVPYKTNVDHSNQVIELEV